MSRAASKLFKPIRVGNLQLSHRVVLAPLTRFRADDAHVPTDIMADYYAQRASVPGSLLITEATFIAAKAGGYDNVPCLACYLASAISQGFRTPLQGNYVPTETRGRQIDQGNR